MTSALKNAAPADLATPTNPPSPPDKKPEAALTAEFVQRGRDRAPSKVKRPEDVQSAPTTSTALAAPPTGEMAEAAGPRSWWSGVAVFLIVFVVGFAATLLLLGVIPDLTDFVLGIPPKP